MGLNDWKISLQVVIDQTQSKIEIEKLIKQIQLKSKIKLGVDSTSVTKFSSELNRLTKANTIQSWADNNSRAMKKYGTEINGIISKFQNLDKAMSLTEAQKLQTKFRAIQLTARQTGDLGATAGEKLHKAWEKFGGWSIATTSFISLIHSIKKGLKLINEFDDAMTDVAYTSDITASGLQNLGNKSMLMAKDLKTSAVNILEAVKIYSTANSTAEDILRKAKPAIILSNTSGMSGAESSKTIQTSLNQFDLEGSEKSLLDIVDTLEFVSSQLNYDFTAGIKDITEGIEASGSVAHNAGLDMQEYATMVGLAVEKTGQSGSTIGNAFKTIFSRITKASSTEGTLDEDISKAEGALRGINIQVRDSEKEFRDLSDIMHDIGSVWNSLTSVQKSNVGFEVAGIRQLNILNSLFGSWERYEDIMSGIDERAGMAMKNQEVYADSLKGHLGELTATGQSIWTNLLNSEGLKNSVGILDSLLVIIDKITSSLGLLGTVGLVGGGILSAKKVGIFKNNNISNIISQYTKLSNSITRYNGLQNKSQSFQNAYNRSLQNSTSTIGKYLTSLNGANASISGFIKYLGAAKASTIALTAASAAMNIAMTVGLSVGIGVLVSQISKLINAQEEARQAAQESANTYKESRMSLEEYTKKYQELHTALLKAKGNEEETYNIKKQLLELQTELNDKYGDEYGKINLATDAYKDQTNAIKELNRENANKFLNENKSQIDTAEEEMTEKRHYNLSDTGISKYTDANKELLDIVKKYENQGIDTLEDTDGSFSIHLNADATDAEDIIQSFMTDIRTKAKELGDEHIFDDVLNMSSSTLSDAQKTIKDFGDTYSEALFAQIAADPTGKLQEGYNKVNKAVESYNEAVLKSDDAYNDENVKKAYEDYENIKSDILNDEDWNKFSYILENIWDSVNTKVFELKEAINSDKEGIGRFVDKLKSYRDVDLQAIADSKDSDIFDSLSKYAEEYNISIIELIENLVKLGFIQGKISDKANNDNPNNSLPEIDTSFSLTEDQIKEINTFQSKISNLQSVLEKLNTGTLSDSEMLDLLQEFPELSDKTDDLTKSVQNLGSKLKKDLLTSLGSNAPTALTDSIESIVDKLFSAPDNIDMSSITNVIDQLNTKLKPAFDSMKSAYEDIFTSDDFTLKNIDFSALNSIKSQIDELNKISGVSIDYKSYENLARVLTDSSSSADEVHKAFNLLADDFLYNSNLLDNVTEETSSLMVTYLESIGITNARVIVEEALARAQNDRYLAEQCLQISGKNLFDVTANEIAIMVHQGKITSDIAGQMSNLALKKQWVNRNAITTSGDIKNMAELANASSKLSRLLTALANAKGAAATGKKAAAVFEGTIQDLEKQINDLLNGNAGNNINGGYTPPSYSPPSNDKNKNNGADKSKKDQSEYFDWAEHSMDVLSRKVSELQKKLENTDGWNAQLAVLKEIEKAQNKIIAGYQKQVSSYEKQYKKSLKGLKAEDVKALENGTKFDLDKFKGDSKYYEKLKNAQKAWKDLVDAESNLTDSKNQLKENKEDQIQLQIDKYSSIIEKWESRLNNASSADKKNEYLREILAAQKKEIENELKLAKTAEEKIILKEKLKGIITDTAKAEFDNMKEEYDTRTSNINAKAGKVDSQIALTEAKGQQVGQAYYDELMRLEKKNQTLLEAERKKLQKKLDDAVKSGSVEIYSQKWYEMRADIMGVETALIDSSTALVNFKNTMNELKWNSFDNLIAKIKQVSDESDFLINLMSNKDMVDDSGKFTKDGLAVLGMHGTKYETYYKQVDQYKKAITEINAELAKDPNNQKLIDRKNELISAQQNAILSAEQEKQAMISLAQEGIQAEVDAYEKLIETKKKALQESKELEDYNRSIQEKTKSIAQIQKRLNVLEGDDSQEAQKKIRELKEQLKNAQTDLSDTQKDKAYNDKLDELDASLEDYKKSMEDYSKNTEDLFTKMMNTVNANSSTVASTIESTAKSVGYMVSSTLTSAWSTAGTVLSEYNGTFKNTSTNMLLGLSSIEASWLSVAAAAETAAKAQLSAIQDFSKTSNVQSILEKASGTDEITDKTSELNRYVFSKYGTRLSRNDMVKLASELGVSGVTEKSIVNNTKLKDKLLSALKNAGFSNGGVAGDIQKIAKFNGDSALATIRPMETVLTERFTKMLPYTVDVMGEFIKSPIVDSLSNLQNLPASNVTQSIDQSVTIGDIELSNVVDGESFVYELKNNPKVRKAIHAITLGEMNHGGVFGKYRV